MSNLFLKRRVVPALVIGAALALSACANNGKTAQNALGIANGLNTPSLGFGGLNAGGFNPEIAGVNGVIGKNGAVKATRYGGQYALGTACRQCAVQPVYRPVIENVNIVELPAPAPAPIIEYVYEQPQAVMQAPAPVYVPEPAPAPVYVPEPAPVYVPEPAPAPAPVYVPEPAPVYVPQPAPVYEPAPAPLYQPTPSCPDGQIPAYNGEGCIAVVPLRK